MPYKDKTGEKTVIEDVEDDVDEPPDSYLSKVTKIVFDRIDNGNTGVLPPSYFLT